MFVLEHIVIMLCIRDINKAISIKSLIDILKYGGE